MLPRPRKHRRSARQAFRSSGSIVELFPLDDFRRILMGGTPDTSSGTKSDKQSQDYHNQTIQPTIYRGLFNILFQPTSHHQRPYRKGDEAREKQHPSILFQEALHDKPSRCPVYFSDSDFFPPPFTSKRHMRIHTKQRNYYTNYRYKSEQLHQRTFGSQVFIIGFTNGLQFEIMMTVQTLHDGFNRPMQISRTVFIETNQEISTDTDFPDTMPRQQSRLYRICRS